MTVYDRTNAVPNQTLCLRATFRRFNQPFDPYSVGPVRITKKDPRDVTYVEGTDLLETIPQNQVSKVGVGLYQYFTMPSTIAAPGTYYDAVTFLFEAGGDPFVVVNTFVVTTTGVPKIGYITVQDLRDEGLTDTVKYTDAMLNKRIAYWSRQIESWLGRWFEPRSMIIDVDGQGSWELQLDFPIVQVQKVTLLDQEFPITEVYTYELADLVVYNRHITQGLIQPDDREDPRIGNIYFPKGRLNVRLQGVFGYTNTVGATPVEIERVVTLLVLRDKEGLASPKRNSSLLSGLAGVVLEERTDDHSYKIGAPTRSMGTLSYYTGDPEIDQILMTYRRPLHIGKNLGANFAGDDTGSEQDRFRAGFDFYYGRSL